MTIRFVGRLFAVSCLALLSACAMKPKFQRMSELECMARAMYFESNRSSEDGMIGVGTVVMNRVNSPQFPNTVCGVVGQKNQFAPGVLTKDMAKGRELAVKSAQKVLRGARHSGVGKRAMFFHTAGYSFPYTNMHYVAILGGNAFYEKRKDAHVTQAEVKARTHPVARPAASPSRRARAVAVRPVTVAAPARPAPRLAPMTIEDVIRAEASR